MKLILSLVVIIFFSIACSKKEKTVYIYYDNNNLKSEVTYFNYPDTSKFHLKYFYKEGGIKLETSFEKGKRVGKYKTYFKNGRMKEVYNYKEGRKNGTFSLYNNQGILINENYYLKGKLILSKLAKYNEEKEVFRHIYYKPINKTDLYKIGYLDYDKDGQLLKQESFFYVIKSVDTLQSSLVISFLNKKDDYLLLFKEQAVSDSGCFMGNGEQYKTTQNELKITYNADDIIVGTIFLTKNKDTLDFPFYFNLTTAREIFYAIGINPVLDSIQLEKE